MKQTNNIANIFTAAKAAYSENGFYGRYGRSKAIKAIYAEAQRRLAYAESRGIDYTNAVFREKVEKNLSDISHCLPSSGYSMGEYRFARTAGNIVGTCNNTQEYARSCKWKATHGRVECYIPVRFAYEAKVIGGLPTIVADGKTSIRRAEWLEFRASYDGRGKIRGEVSVKVVKGWVADGYHAATYTEACEMLKRARRQAKVAAARRREEARARKAHHAEMARIKRAELREEAHKDKVREAKTPAQLAALVKGKTFRFADSLKAGNCNPGSVNFCRVVGISTDAELTALQLAEYVFNPHLSGFRQNLLRMFIEAR